MRKIINKLEDDLERTGDKINCGMGIAVNKTAHATGTALTKTKGSLDKALDKTGGAVKVPGRRVKKAGDEVKDAGV